MRRDALIFGNRQDCRHGLCLPDKRAWREGRTALALYFAPGLDVVGLAGHGLPASEWSFGYTRSFSRRASAFDSSICFVPRSRTSLQGVPGSASPCLHAVIDYLFFSSASLVLLGARCRHFRACQIADYGRFAAPNISVPTQTTGSGRSCLLGQMWHRLVLH